MTMRVRLAAALAALVALALATWPALASVPAFAPAPAWVQPAALPDAGDSLPTSDGTRYLLLDDQVDARTGEPVWYRRIASRLEGPRALADGGQLQIEFQPDYQRVVVHAIDVHRGEVVSDRRKVARFETLRREEDLDSIIYDGAHTLSITVPDLRVGDIVDFSYSIVGDNPVFGDSYQDNWTARFGTALGYRRVRALYDPARPLHGRAPDGFQRREGEAGASRFVEFVARRLPRTRTEDDAPSSFDPWGRIELTTASTWSDVVRWALPMYVPRLRDRALASELVRTLHLEDADKRAAMLRAIAFVEGEIRYTALDMGKNSHEPNLPETVVARRFGDCKDKAVLLSALLHEAGIRAEPVLVDTEGRESLAARLPSASAFDHVVVRAHHAGKTWWIDPTRDPETGPLEDRTPLPFRLGLPLCAQCDRLVEIPQPHPRAPDLDVGQRIDLRSVEGGYRADFTVVTDYRNERADSVRDQFDGGDEDVGKRYLRYMRKYYGELRSNAAPVLRDAANVGARAIERYTLRWDADEGGEFPIVLFQLSDYVPDLDLDTRATPLALDGPAFARQTIRTHLAGGWRIDGEDTRIENAYFRFLRTVRVQGDRLEIVGEWHRLADQVPAADYATVRADVDRVRKLLEYNVDIGPDTAATDASGAGWGWVALFFFLFSVLLGVTVIRQEAQLRRLRNPVRTASPEVSP